MGQEVKVTRVVSLNGKKRFGGKISHTKPRAYYPCYSGAGQEIGEVTEKSGREGGYSVLSHILISIVSHFEFSSMNSTTFLKSSHRFNNSGVRGAKADDESRPLFLYVPRILQLIPGLSSGGDYCRK